MRSPACPLPISSCAPSSWQPLPLTSGGSTLAGEMFAFLSLKATFFLLQRLSVLLAAARKNHLPLLVGQTEVVDSCLSLSPPGETHLHMACQVLTRKPSDLQFNVTGWSSLEQLSHCWAQASTEPLSLRWTGTGTLRSSKWEAGDTSTRRRRMSSSHLRGKPPSAWGTCTTTAR